MRMKSWLRLPLVAGWIVGCGATTDSYGDNQVVAIRLAATQQNAGKIAQATLAPLGDETSITLFIGGVPSGLTRPVHLYTYIYPGACGSLGAQPAYEMNQTVNTDRYTRGAGWTLSKKAPVVLSRLLSGDYAIVVRTSPADSAIDIFCGDIK